jgi:type IV pilus assembly protein PilQ
LPGDQFQIELTFNGAPPSPEVFEIASPARLSMDFAGVASRLDNRRYELTYRIADSVVVLESQGRTRLVVNLRNPTAYNTSVAGNVMTIVVGDDAVANAPVSTSAVAASTPVRTPSMSEDITGVDFRRGENGEGQIVIQLNNRGVIGNVDRAGSSLELEFENSTLLDSLQSRMDVSDFATPVQFIDVYEQGGDVMINATINGDYDFIAYQANGQYVLSVSQLAALETNVSGQGNQQLFSGERISLNFQDIDVRTVLQILADFNDFSLVVSDNVGGSITLRLVDVPWDQALDLVLKSRGLDKRATGNVLYIAPASEIAAAELQALENSQAAESLSPLVTEYIEVNYAVAADMVVLLAGDGEGRGRILSDRGNATVDSRTNTLIVQDAAANIQQVRELLRRLDVPVKQVLIEARIVNSRVEFSKSLGIQWGGAKILQGTGDTFVLGGGIGTTIAQTNAAITGVATPVLFPDALGVDLGLAGQETSSIALGYAGNSSMLQLEISALESSGGGEVIAQPRVTTQDQQQAEIRSGFQVPYQAQAGGTAGGSTTEFVDAVLSLNVTPQITPDNRIIMLLDVTQDSVVTGSPGTVPAIATNSVTTRVLVDDGDTIVLGGVFREEKTDVTSKTPILGDLPYIGRLFKRTEEDTTKTELLIFITPTIINDI